jgi:polygalacturonase
MRTVKILLSLLSTVTAAISTTLSTDFCASPDGPSFFNIIDYGGVGDGVTMNTKAFVAVIKAAASQFTITDTPQRVLISNGVYLSGSISFESGVFLCVLSDARLLASANQSDYPTDESKWAFLYSFGVKNIGIGGGGVVDGDFMKYAIGWNETNDQILAGGWSGCSGECRPQLATFVDTVNIAVDSITFEGSPDWTFHLVNCTDVVVANWTQRGDERWPNNDGIDIDSCRNVLLRDSTIDTGDDGVCIKGGRAGGKVFNVTVQNVRVRSRSSAIKFGSNTGIPMHALLFKDIIIQDSNRGLALQARDGPCAGPCIYDVTFRNILINGTRWWPQKWWGDGSPIYISTMLRTPDDGATGVANITFENILAYSQNAAVLSGRLPGGHVSGVTLRNVTINIDHPWSNWNYTSLQGAYPNIEYDPSTVPHLAPGSPISSRRDMSGWMPGLYVENVEGLELDDVKIAFRGIRMPYWGNICVNTTDANYTVTVKGGSCVLGL